MILILTFVVIGMVVYSMLREGLFNAICFLFSVVFSGMVAFHFWPTLANAMEDSFQGSVLAHCEDGLALFGIFALMIGLCKLLTNMIAYRDLDIPPMVSQVGGGIVGAVVGYLLAGFLVAALQTLPWDEKFLGYIPPATEKVIPEKGQLQISNKIFPPDQVWLKLMKRASVVIFENEDVKYEQSGTPYDEFTYYFSKYRRFQPDGKPLPIPKPPPPAKKDNNEGQGQGENQGPGRVENKEGRPVENPPQNPPQSNP